MLKFRSLTSKFFFIGTALFVFLSIYVYIDFYTSNHLKNELASINYANNETVLIHSLSYKLMAMLFIPPDVRGLLLKSAEKEMAEYERTLYLLRDGSKELRLKPIPKSNKESTTHIDTLIELWERTQKPAILSITKLPPERKNEACGMCHSAIRDNIEKISVLADSLVKHHKEEMKDFDIFRIYTLGFFLIANIFIMFFVKGHVVSPLKKLRFAAKEIEKGNFDVRADIKSRDEIGVLGSTFNSMAQTIEVLIDEKTRHLKDLEILNRLSSAVNRTISLEDIANAALDEILNLEQLKLVRKGTFFVVGEEQNLLKLIAYRGLSEEFGRFDATVPMGECLCGIAAETGDVEVSEDCFTDERHSRQYPEITEHGHICLPFKAGDKVLGVLGLYLHSHTRLSDEEITLYKSLADIIAISLKNALQHTKVERIASNLSEAQRISHLGNWEWDIEKNELRWSDEIYRIFGLKPQEFRATYEAFLNAVHPDDRELVIKSVEDALHAKKPYSIDHRIVLPDGSVRFVHEQAEVIFDDNGRQIKMLGTVQDITERKLIQEELMKSREYIQSILDNSIDLIFTVKTDGTFNYFNKSLKLLLGYEEEDLRGRPFIEYVVEDERAGIINDWGKALRGVPGTYETRIIKAGGDIIDVFYSYSFLNKYNEVLVVLRDISEKKKAEEKLRRQSSELLSLANASNVISAVTLPEDIYEAVCNIAVRNFELRMVWIGIVEEGSYDVRPAAWYGHEDGYLSRIKITWDDSETGIGPTGTAIKTMSPQVVNDIGKDFRYKPWREEAIKRGYRSSMALPLISSESKVIGVINLYSDTPYFFTRERIRLFQIFANHAATAIENTRLISGLENKVRERTAELEIARIEADSANKAKSDFLANMSHELRTPLNSIMGFSEFMLLGMAGELNNEKQEEFLRDIYSSGDHLLSLINDILDLSKIEAGMVELEYEDIDIEDIIEDSLVFFKEKSLKHNITITTEVEEGIGSLQADKRMIKQVLVNLLSNAVKFTPDGGAVTVRAERIHDAGYMIQDKNDTRYTMQDAGSHHASDIMHHELGIMHHDDESGIMHPDMDFVEISVEDTGIGIKEEDIPKLFQPFQQLEDPYEKRFQGTGLGLSLCRNIVELHGGRIWVESEHGKGSRFTFLIPISIIS